MCMIGLCRAVGRTLITSGECNLRSDLSARLMPADSANVKPIASDAVAQQRRKRVLFIINSLAGGGAERVMCTLLRASQPELRDCRISLLLLDREASRYEVPRWIDVEQLDCRHSLVRSVWSVW